MSPINTQTCRYYTDMNCPTYMYYAALSYQDNQNSQLELQVCRYLEYKKTGLYWQRYVLNLQDRCGTIGRKYCFENMMTDLQYFTTSVEDRRIYIVLYLNSVRLANN
jgi:hypothetical protein